MKTVCLCVSGYRINHGLFAICVDGSRVVPLREMKAGALGKTLVVSLDSPVSLDPFSREQINSTFHYQSYCVDVLRYGKNALPPASG